MAFPIDQLPTDVAALLEHLQCPVCIEIKANTRLACEAGHALCAECVSQLKRDKRSCPTCRQALLVKPVVCQPINTLAQALGITAPPPPLLAAAAPAAPDYEAPNHAIAAPEDQRRIDPLVAQAQLRLRLRRGVQNWINKFEHLTNRLNDARRSGLNEPAKRKLRLDLSKAVMKTSQKLAEHAAVLGVPYDGWMPHEVFGLGLDRMGVPLLGN
jgi:hypothetical protein